MNKILLTFKRMYDKFKLQTQADRLTNKNKKEGLWRTKCILVV